jgi:hypothetical protein
VKKKVNKAGKSQKSKKSKLAAAVYRLPSLSKCIENNILPRDSEYMKKLYSIAHRNHENQVMAIVKESDRKEQS